MRIVHLSLLALLAACDSGEHARSPVPGGEVARGRLLLAQYQCGSCHRIPEVAAARGTVGPALDSYGRRSYIAGQIPNRPEALARWIVDPAALKPGTAMPAMGVSPADARDMAAYLYSLP
nr:c-type cytochrome [uncultured Duganella sp.]